MSTIADDPEPLKSKLERFGADLDCANKRMDILEAKIDKLLVILHEVEKLLKASPT